MKKFLTDGTYPNDIGTSDSAKYRFKVKAQDYEIKDGVVISKVDGRIWVDDKKAVLDKEIKNVMGGRDKLFYYIKQKYVNITERDCMAYIKGNSTLQKHAPIKKQKIFRKIESTIPFERFQCDWIIMDQIRVFKYIFTIIDHNTKKAWIYKTGTRDQDRLVEKIEPLFQKYKPKILQCDNEFNSKSFKDMLERSGTKLIHSSAYKPNSNGAIERFNGTYKRILFKLLTDNKSKDWPLYADKACEIYNNTYHSTIKATPEFNHTQMISTPIINDIKDPPKFKVGDKVRRLVNTKTEDKSYKQQWTDNVYKIIKINNYDIASYTIQNISSGEILSSKFYNHNLLLV